MILRSGRILLPTHKCKNLLPHRSCDLGVFRFMIMQKVFLFLGADSFCSIPHDYFDEKKFRLFIYVEGRLGAHETNYSKTF